MSIFSDEIVHEHFGLPIVMCGMTWWLVAKTVVKITQKKPNCDEKLELSM